MAERSVRHILLVGNAPHSNRGCAGLFRGTVNILRRAFGPKIRITSANFGNPNEIEKQAREESDGLISYLPLWYDRFTVPWLMDQLNRRMEFQTPGKHWVLRHVVKEVDAALEIGGDNYSLDYGFPFRFIELDRYLLSSGIPVFLWGASVGPFTREPEMAEMAHEHLRRLSGVMVRESVSLEYLQRHGVSQGLALTADPAFALEAAEPRVELHPRADLSARPVGLNFSPLMARYVTGGDMEAWRNLCADTASALLRAVRENLLFVPHVFQPAIGNDDGEFLESVAEIVRRRTGCEIPVASRRLTAEEIKWLVARCSAVTGARMHVAIAALSSEVPTLSLAYSIKAVGMNRDIFGHEEFCLEARAICPETVTGRLTRILANREQIRQELHERIPVMVARAFHGGELLRERLVSDSTHRIG